MCVEGHQSTKKKSPFSAKELCPLLVLKDWQHHATHSHTLTDLSTTDCCLILSLAATTTKINHMVTANRSEEKERLKRHVHKIQRYPKDSALRLHE
jgi:hypothetical protein